MEGNFRGKGRWYPGVIKRVRLDGTVDIDYDDGEQETRVGTELIRAVDAAAVAEPAAADVPAGRCPADLRPHHDRRRPGRGLLQPLQPDPKHQPDPCSVEQLHFDFFEVYILEFEKNVLIVSSS